MEDFHILTPKAGVGDDSPKIIFSELARRFPQHTFYYVSVNDITKCRDACKPLGGFGMCKKTCDIPDNIVDIYHSVSLRIAGIEKYKDGEYPHEILLDECKKRNLHFDFAIFEQGPDCGFSVMNRGIWLTSHPDRHAVAMAMANHYCGPLISFINEMKMPWVNITEDIFIYIIKIYLMMNCVFFHRLQLILKRSALQVITMSHTHIAIQYSILGMLELRKCSCVIW